MDRDIGGGRLQVIHSNSTESNIGRRRTMYVEGALHCCRRFDRGKPG